MNFDRVAPFYQLLETIAFGNALMRARSVFVSYVRSRKHALIIGDGDGRFCSRISHSNPSLLIDFVDCSAAMINRARVRLKRRPNINFHCIDFREWNPPTRYDLVASHFFLDCFSALTLQSVIAKVAALMTADGAWLISDFNLPPEGWRRWHAQIWLKMMYSFFHFTADLKQAYLVDPAPILSRHGFVLAAEEFARFQLLRAQLWRLRPTTAAGTG